MWICFELFRQKAQNGTATDVTDDDVKKALRAIETRVTELQTKRAYQVKLCVRRALQSAALNLAYTLLINEATLSKCIATFAAILATNVVEGVEELRRVILSCCGALMDILLLIWARL
jgi:uncharacterized metal-binding protein